MFMLCLCYVFNLYYMLCLRVRFLVEKFRTTIYVPKDVWERFLELCRREDEPASRKVSQWIRSYVERHYPGNPQLRIEAFTEEAEREELLKRGNRRYWSCYHAYVEYDALDKPHKRCRAEPGRLEVDLQGCAECEFWTPHTASRW